MSKAGRAGYCISVGYSRFDPANSGQKCGRNNQRKGDCKAEDRSLYLWLFGSVEVVHNKTLPTPKVTRHKFGGSVYPLVPVGPRRVYKFVGATTGWFHGSQCCISRFYRISTRKRSSMPRRVPLIKR